MAGIGCSVEMGFDLHFLVPTLLPCEVLADPAEHCCYYGAPSYTEQEQDKEGLGNAECAWIRKPALQSLTLPGSAPS